MKIVLLNDVPKVGRKYDVKNVANGFAMNSLIPRGLAKVATDSALKELEELKKMGDARKKVREDLLLKNIKETENISVELSGKANEQGHLFAGIHADELILAVKEQTGLDLDIDHVVLKEPLKEIGEHKVTAKVGELETQFTVNIKEQE